MLRWDLQYWRETEPKPLQLEQSTKGTRLVGLPTNPESRKPAAKAKMCKPHITNIFRSPCMFKIQASHTGIDMDHTLQAD